ncbi:MAG: tetratricopeptide repeat protein [Bacteroidota bacterium]
MKHILTLSLVLLTLISFSQPSNENVYKSRGLFREGVQKGVNKNYDEAISLFSEAIELNPIYAEAFLYRGLALNEIRDFESAIKDFTICIELDPEFSDQAHFFRGVAKVQEGKYNSAIQDYSTAIQLNPDFIAFYRRGQANMHLKEYARALQDFEIALRLNPSHNESYLHRGIALYYLGQFPEALKDLKRAALDLKKNPEAYYYSALARGKTNDYYGAVRDLDKAIELNPDYAKAYQARAHAHKELGNSENEAKDIEMAQNLNIENAESSSVEFDASVAEATTKDDTNKPLPDFAKLFQNSQKEKQAETKNNQENKDVNITQVKEPVSTTINSDDDIEVTNEVKHEEKESVKITSEPIETPNLTNLETGFYNKNLNDSKPMGYGVQIASYTNTENLLSLTKAYENQFEQPVFINISNINKNRIYRLIVGEFPNRIAAESLRDKLRENDFPDCFLIVYENLK